jgi:agmatine deiminase
VWLPDGLADDDETDGHVDNIVAFPRPGVVLLQGCDDPVDPDHANAATCRRLLAEAGLVVVELPVLPTAVPFGGMAQGGDPARPLEVPYLNLYPVNGGVLVPVTGHPFDRDALDVIGSLYEGREVVPVPADVIAFGGGGPHCITQQVPAAPRSLGGGGD